MVQNNQAAPGKESGFSSGLRSGSTSSNDTETLVQKQDISQLDNFLSAFFPNEKEPINLRAVDAKGAQKQLRKQIWQKTTSRLALQSDVALRSEIENINLQRGVYFVVNTGGNKDENITRFNAFFVENDNLPIAEQLKRLNDSPIKPSIQVETKKSIHAYWLIDGTCSADEWRKMQRLLIEYFDGDRSISNPSRIMRLPGFNHVQYNESTSKFKYKPVCLVSFESARRYTLEAMQAAFEATKLSENIATAQEAQTVNSAFLSEIEINPQEAQELAQKCLPYLSLKRCDDYYEWLNVGIALYNVFTGNDTGLDLWREWSKQSQKYQNGVCEEKWQTFCERTDSTKLTAGSLVHWAREDSPRFTELWTEQITTKREQNKSNNFGIKDSGIYFTGKNNDGESQEIRICSRLEITAASRDSQSGEWGRLLEFEDMDGNAKKWLMPMSLLAGDGNEYRSRLLSQGLQIEPSRKAKELLSSYIQTASPQARVRCVSKIGWYGQTFVLPDITFGETENERVLFQTEFAPDHRLNSIGNLQDWQSNIAHYCLGNSRLVFALSAAFAGALLPLIDEQGGGFHFRGASSLGKTTTLLIAGSVWGGGTKNGFIQTWRTTANGLESIAEIHNHGLLCLDEISECEAKTVGETAYMLANGQGKARMNKSINARKRLEWNLVFLSSGEQSLADMIAQSGERIRGGQQVRMCDLEADAGKEMGLFENLHHFGAADELANHLRRASLTYYGTPIRAFLERLVIEQNDVNETWRKYRDAFIKQAISGNEVSSEVRRVCSRFALVGLAGEIATTLNVTAWKSQTATVAAQELFRVWLAGRGTSGASDTENAVRQVIAFLEAHGASRFQTISAGAKSSDIVFADETRVINRVGFKRVNETTKETEYLILREAFKNEVCKGFSATATAKELYAREMLRRQNERDYTVVERLPELGAKRVYAIRLPTE